jgi:hypothetical protein
MYNWKEDRLKILKPSHFRRAVNFSWSINEYLDQQNLEFFEVSDLLADRMRVLDVSSSQVRDKKARKLFSQSNRLERESADITIISLMAQSSYYYSLLLIMQSCDELSNTFGCYRIANSENRIFGASNQIGGGYYQLLSEYIFRD